jgi:hypothetical protein
MFRVLLRSRIQSSYAKTIIPLHSSAIQSRVRTLSCSMPSKKDDKYTDPELREEVKEEIQAGDKGGAPGQWSARKVYLTNSL